MKYYFGNVMNLVGENVIICVTTNKFVKKNGEAVMGCGIAKQVASYGKKLGINVPAIVGQINKMGLNVAPIFSVSSGSNSTTFVTFCVKPEWVIYNGNNIVNHMKNKFKIGDKVPGWAAKADLEIIRESALELTKFLELDTRTVYLPFPGIGAGKLSRNEVLFVIDPILGFSDRIILCQYKRKGV